MDHLPSEITTQILSRLPVKFVFRCRSVCKTWMIIIDDRRLFASLHFTRSLEEGTNNKSTFIFASSGNCHPVYIVGQEHEQSLFKSTQIHVSDSNYNAVHANSFNGLLCFSTKTKQSNGFCTYIHNPATQECVKLPDSNSSQELTYINRGVRFFVYNLGFGLDHSSNVLKVLQVIGVSHGLRHAAPAKAQVCTVGSNSWRKLENFPRVSWFRGTPALINGSLHWMSYEHILSFDLATEKFGFVELPQINLPRRRHGVRPGNDFRLVALDGCLSVADSSSDEDIELWIMKEYNVKESWIKLVIRRRYVEDAVFKNVIPISFWKNGELLLLYGSTILVSYEIESGRYTPLEIEGLPAYRYDSFKGSYAYEVFSYVGNLMSIDTICRTQVQLLS
ncbi:F-box protein [Thalictrum thalictroides]|uniref:F-box protein n=1 Tax=Thalictrum thalictroides TaxID=46969 RepID=A0A7J6VM79_THATH|nr:F-box protein [Thalictrum thalictroides]